jgi:hypothetical protein
MHIFFRCSKHATIVPQEFIIKETIEFKTIYELLNDFFFGKVKYLYQLCFDTNNECKYTECDSFFVFQVVNNPKNADKVWGRTLLKTLPE